MIYRFGDCTLDTTRNRVQRRGQSIRLRPKVFRVCLYLLEHRDRVISRDELCIQVWAGRFVSQATLEGVIRAVREALGDSGRTQGIIQTSRGYGYRFVASVEERRPQARGEAELELTPAWESTSGCDPSGETRAWLGVRRPGIALVALGLVVLGLWGGITHTTIGPLEKSRLAVLPFLDLSVEADQESFADGMTEESIAQLSQIPGLTVIPRTWVMQYKGSRKDVATIGRELGVGTILEGSVRKLDQQVRVSVQLIDVASQGHLWSQDYHQELTGVYATQQAIATLLVQGLKGQLPAEPNSKHGEGGPWLPVLVHTIGRGH
jgi:TolB-like protein/DNA-binding winged helix-turn-helix (wHTH) protein